MLQLLYQRMPMRTEQVSEKPDEILEENFFELTSQPTGLVILLVFSCYEERTKFRLGCEALWTTRLEWYLCLHPPQHR